MNIFDMVIKLLNDYCDLNSFFDYKCVINLIEMEEEELGMMVIF